MARGIDVDDWQKRPEIKKLVNAAFPTYRRKKVVIIPTTTVALQQLEWDGGTKNEYQFLWLDGSYVPWMDQYKEGGQVKISKGKVIIQSGTFCGKPALCHIYIHPDDGPDIFEKATKMSNTND